MANKNTPASLDKWREFFRGANSDIFNIIKNAIMVAVTDCPNDFKMNRDRIAELLFACKSTKCFGCDRVELALPNQLDVVQKSDDGKCKSGIETGTKESKANSSGDDQREVVVEMRNGISNCSYGDVEALTDDLEEESQLFGEVLRIKEVLDNFQEEVSFSLFVLICFLLILVSTLGCFGLIFIDRYLMMLSVVPHLVSILLPCRKPWFTISVLGYVFRILENMGCLERFCNLS